MNIPTLFFRKSKEHLNKTAFIIFRGDEKEEVSFQEIVSEVIRFAGYLSGKVTTGDRIALCSENRTEWCSSYLAILTVGCIAVPFDTELGEEEIKKIISVSESKFVFCSDQTAEKIRACGIPDHAIVNFDVKAAGTEQEEEIDLGTYLSRSDYNDLASIIFTSGTTGTPKGVMLTHKNFISNAKALVETGIVTEQDNMLSVLPLHHTYAFMCTFFIPLTIGATVTYPSSLKGPDMAHAIKEGGVTILVGVPQLLDLLYLAIKRKIDDMPFLKRSIVGLFMKTSRLMRERFDINLGRRLFSSVQNRFGKQFRVMTSGGASLSVDTMKGLETFGFTVLEGYGLTETSPAVSFNPLEKRKPGSAGKPLPGVEVMVKKEEEDSESAEGEIVIKGNMLMRGYYNMPEETDKVLRNGWFYSGDLGYIDDDRYIFLTGRKKEVIVLSSGKNIYPEEIEQQYQKIPLVKELCVLDVKEGDTVSLHGLVVPDFEYAKSSKIANLYEALKWDIHGVSLKLPQYMRLKGFTLYTEPLPRTRLGKLRRFMIKTVLSTLRSKKRKPEAVQTEEVDDISGKVVECVKKFVQEGVVIRLADNIELDLGIDSLKRIELTAELERTFAVDLPETFMVDVQTVSDLCSKIKEVGHGVKTTREEPITFRDVLMKKPDESQIRTIGFKQGIVKSLFVWSVLKAIKLFYRIYFRSKVKGVENIPDSPFILVANHSSYLDGFLIGSHIHFSTYRNLFFQGAQKYFESLFMRCFAHLGHVIPIDPDAYLASAFSLSAHVLNREKSLCIFPEGGRSFDGSVMSFRKGIGILAYECRVPIVPARIHGAFDAMPRGRILPKRKGIRLVIGEPITVEKMDEIKRAGGDHYQVIADVARQRVMDL